MILFEKRHKAIEEAIKRWYWDNFYNYKTHISTGFEIYGTNVYIYSNKPGILIGKYGETIDKLKDELKQYGIRHIYTIEIGNGNYIRRIKVSRKLF